MILIKLLDITHMLLCVSRYGGGGWSQGYRGMVSGSMWGVGGYVVASVRVISNSCHVLPARYSILNDHNSYSKDIFHQVLIYESKTTKDRVEGPIFQLPS